MHQYTHKHRHKAYCKDALGPLLGYQNHDSPTDPKDLWQMHDPPLKRTIGNVQLFGFYATSASTTRVDSWVDSRKKLLRELRAYGPEGGVVVFLITSLRNKHEMELLKQTLNTVRGQGKLTPFCV